MKQTQTTDSVVRTQLLPLTDMHLVLPNTCIAEVISFQTVEPIKNSADWLLGMTSWRGVYIPVISFEKANEVAAEEISKHSRIAVLNGLDSEIPFYGVVVQGIPKLITVQKSEISVITKPDVKLPIAQQQTMIHSTSSVLSAVIPDQKKIEKMLKKEGVKVG